MFKKSILIIFLFFLWSQVNAQAIRVLASSFGIKEIPMKPDEITGTEFFFDEPKRGNISLEDSQTLHKQLFNITLRTNELLLESEGRVYAIVLTKVDEIKLEDGSVYIVEEVGPDSPKVFEPLIYGGKVELFRGYFLNEKMPNYNISHDVGNRSSVLTVTANYYLRVGGGDLIEVPEQRRKRRTFFVKVLGSKAADLIEEKDYSLRSEQQMYTLIADYNKEP